jgi:hypothetical protein
MKQDTGPEYGRGKCLFAATKFECDGDVTYYRKCRGDQRLWPQEAKTCEPFPAAQLRLNIEWFIRPWNGKAVLMCRTSRN